MPCWQAASDELPLSFQAPGLQASPALVAWQPGTRQRALALPRATILPCRAPMLAVRRACSLRANSSASSAATGLRPVGTAGPALGGRACLGGLASLNRGPWCGSCAARPGHSPGWCHRPILQPPGCRPGRLRAAGESSACTSSQGAGTCTARLSCRPVLSLGCRHDKPQPACWMPCAALQEDSCPGEAATATIWHRCTAGWQAGLQPGRAEARQVLGSPAAPGGLGSDTGGPWLHLQPTCHTHEAPRIKGCPCGRRAGVGGRLYNPHAVPAQNASSLPSRQAGSHLWASGLGRHSAMRLRCAALLLDTGLLLGRAGRKGSAAHAQRRPVLHSPTQMQECRLQGGHPHTAAW